METIIRNRSFNDLNKLKSLRDGSSSETRIQQNFFAKMAYYRFLLEMRKNYHLKYEDLSVLAYCGKHRCFTKKDWARTLSVLNSLMDANVITQEEACRLLGVPVEEYINLVLTYCCPMRAETRRHAYP